WNVSTRSQRFRIQSGDQELRSQDRIRLRSFQRSQDGDPRRVWNLLQSDTRAHLRVRILLQSALRARLHPIARFPQSFPPCAAAAALSSEAPVGDSNYHSLQVGLNRRFSHGVQSQLSYTWSKCLDDASGTYGLEGGIPWSNPWNGSFDHGRCLFDRPQVFRVSGVYAFPFKQNILIKGWQMSGGFAAQSGSPWNVTVGFDQSGTVVANSERPNLVMPADQIYTHNINQWVNPAAFTLPAPGTFGNLQRDFLSSPHTVNLDYAVMKDTQLKEQTRLQFRAEF